MLAALLHDVDDIKISPNTYKNKDHAQVVVTKNAKGEAVPADNCIESW